MKSGDLLVSIDGSSTRGWSVAQARKHLLGAAGRPVEVGIVRPSDNSSSQVTLTREAVRPPTVYFTMLEGNVAYIYIAAFGTETPAEFHTAVQRSEAQGARAYAVDVRNDGGGIVGTALSIASEFVPSGPLVSIESNGGKIETFDADDTAIAAKPLVVLVNGYSASASEIMAAAVAESGTGTLVGTRTFGKGVVQTVTRFPDGSAIKITTGRYFTPLNHDINGRGILPAVVVEENAHPVFGTPEKDAQLRRALDVIDEELARG
jgi:carboxyl-terminal processing protease